MGFYSLDCSHVRASSHLSSSILFLSEAEKSAFGEEKKKRKKKKQGSSLAICLEFECQLSHLYLSD